MHVYVCVRVRVYMYIVRASRPKGGYMIYVWGVSVGVGQGVNMHVLRVSITYVKSPKGGKPSIY
jgi:hypothetical protein